MPQKSELVCRKSRFVHHSLCESPFISRDLYAIQPLILCHILGAYVLLIWVVGVVEIVFIPGWVVNPGFFQNGFLRKIAEHYLCLAGGKRGIFVNTTCFGKLSFYRFCKNPENTTKIGVSAGTGQNQKITSFGEKDVLEGLGRVSLSA